MTVDIVFSTQRLILKRFSPTDAQPFYELNLDPEVLRYTGDVPFRSVAEAEAFIRSYDNYKRDGFGRWPVFLKDTRDYIGFCGLNYSLSKQEVDVGFRFLRKHWGKGYATEAALGSLVHGFLVDGLPRIVARARVDNAASQRVIQKLGMRFEKEFLEDNQVWSQYQITRPELESGAGMKVTIV